MRVLVTGPAGLLGRAIIEEAVLRGHTPLALERGDVDVTDAAALTAAFLDAEPQVVVHCAAYTDVDAAELHEAQAMRVNSDSVTTLASLCAGNGALLVYPSTDYVFDGSAATPYLPEHPPSPLNAYGRSKWEGEQAARSLPKHLVARTSWLYGRGGRGFVSTMLRRGAAGCDVEVVTDQIGRPTRTGDLAGAILSLARAGATGTYHVTGGGAPASWYQVACEIFDACGFEGSVQPTSSDVYQRPARRPAYSVLDCASTERIVGPLPEWRSALREHLASSGAAAGAPRPS
jgi:dTDP-4-dehydrorhamnose reductase